MNFADCDDVKTGFEMIRLDESGQEIQDLLGEEQASSSTMTSTPRQRKGVTFCGGAIKLQVRLS